MRRKKINDYKLLYLNDVFEIKLIFYYPSLILQLSDLVWTLNSSV